MDKSFIWGIISLIRSAFTGEAVTLTEDFDFDAAFRLAKSHSIVPVLYYGITNSAISLESELSNKFFTATCQFVAVSEKQKFEYLNLSKEFEENGIDFMPLKGSVIRSLYPKSELRAMGDVDILIRIEQYEKIIPILEKNGFNFINESSNELVWNKTPFRLELHRYLLSPKHKDYFKFFGDGWQYSRLSEGYKHKYEMSDEDFFVFMFAHLTKHYRSSGVGIKHIIDIWIYLDTKPQLDMKYIKRELEKLKMLTFYENVVRMIDVWFRGKAFDDVTYLITEKIFLSGAFGTSESAVKSDALREERDGDKRNKRLKYMFKALFLPYTDMCLKFPFLKKAPVLLPFMWIYRMFYSLFYKKGTFSKYCSLMKNLSVEQISKYETELNAVGLDFNFED